jgi:hypothetical protein
MTYPVPRRLGSFLLVSGLVFCAHAQEFRATANLAKTFNLTERARAELKVAAYNLTNRLNRAHPIMDIKNDINNSGFGTALRQGANLTGRQMEFGLKILF